MIGEAAVIEVSGIVIDGAAAGHSSDDGDLEGPNGVAIDLGHSILIASDDDGGTVSPKHESGSAETAEHGFFQGQIVGRVL